MQRARPSDREKIPKPRKMNVQVIRRPGGAWEKLQDGGKGRQLWKNVGGRRTLTPFGRERLAGWQDLTVHVPVLEYEFENPGAFIQDFRENSKISSFFQHFGEEAAGLFDQGLIDHQS